MEQSRIPPEAECKLQSVERDIQKCRETGNPQHLYYAQTRLAHAVETLRHQWDPETDAK